LRSSAGCLGYGENKRKGDNEGGLNKPCPASKTRFDLIISEVKKKATFSIKIPP
jgi:hypothetical protein